jgi:DNA polymerase III subunit epsilon
LNKFEVADWAKRLQPSALVLDSETTSLSKHDEVIDLAVVSPIDGQVLFNSLFIPQVKISCHASKIHGLNIKYLMQTNAPKFSDKYSDLRDLLTNKTVIAYNAGFDSRMFNQTIARYGLAEIPINWVCMMKQTQYFLELDKQPKLAKACELLEVKAGNHRALGDALAAARIIWRMTHAEEME